MVLMTAGLCGMMLERLDLVGSGETLQSEGSCAGTHLELESELRARLVQGISSVAYLQGR